MLLFVGGIVGPIIDLGYIRDVLITGSVLSELTMITVGWCSRYYQFPSSGFNSRLGSRLHISSQYHCSTAMEQGKTSTIDPRRRCNR